MRAFETIDRAKMLLVMDAGNSNIVIGVFDGEKLLHSWRVSTHRDNRTGDEFAVLLHQILGLKGIPLSAIDGVVVCSVVPTLNEDIKNMCLKNLSLEPLFIKPREQEFIPLNYYPPEEVGADRVVNAVAALELHGSPAIVVDFGTATTFDVVSDKGEYEGGLIFPGIGISSEALFSRTAKLPRVEFRRPARIIGQSTEESIQSGLYFGYVHLIEGVLGQLKEEIPGAVVISTGGFAGMIGRENPGLFDFIEEDLTVKGLKICYDRKKQKQLGL